MSLAVQTSRSRHRKRTSTRPDWPSLGKITAMNTVAAQQAPTQLTDTRADLSLLKAIVNDVLSDTEYVIRLGNSQLNAITGVLLPPLVPGDVVAVFYSSGEGSASIAALLQPVAGTPLADRAVTIRSGQSITLEAGCTLVKLNADGIARIVAHQIQHDARDLVDLDAAEVRIN